MNGNFVIIKYFEWATDDCYEIGNYVYKLILVVALPSVEIEYFEDKKIGFFILEDFLAN